MNLAGDKKFWAIEDARDRIAYGRHYQWRALAEGFAIVRKWLIQKYGTSWEAQAALDSVSEKKEGIIVLAHSFATLLLQLVILKPDALGQLAEAFVRLEDQGATDPRAEEIITAYERCSQFPPSFTELKWKFIDEFGKSRWRSDFSVRKTLRSLALQLRKAKRGRPAGSKSRIKITANRRGR